MLSTTTNKQRMRNLCFRDDIDGDVAGVETNFGETRERREARARERR